MRTPLMILLVIVFLPATIVELSFCQQILWDDPAFRLGDLPAMIMSLQLEDVRSREIARRSQRLTARIDAEHRLLKALGAGQVTLAEAIVRVCEARTTEERDLLFEQLRS